jgi:hypothetical protein
VNAGVGRGTAEARKGRERGKGGAAAGLYQRADPATGPWGQVRMQMRIELQLSAEAVREPAVVAPCAKATQVDHRFYQVHPCCLCPSKA